MRVDVAATSVIGYIKLIDPSAGTPETGLTITNLDVNYIRDGGNPVESNATEHANLNDGYAASKMKEVGAAAPGLYRVDWPDGAFASGVDRVQLIIEGAAVDPAIIECEIGPRESNLTEILGHLMTNTGTRIADAFQTMFDVASPVFTAVSVNQTGDNYARIGANGAGLSNINLPNQTMDIIGSLTGNLIGDVTGNVDGTVAGKTPSEIGDAMTLAAGAITAAVIANAAIDNATFAADVGSTAYATNIIALAVRKALDEIKLDHLVAVADGDDPVDNSIMALLAASDGDWSGFDKATDSLEAIRDAGGGDATAANQTTIINHLTDVKGATWANTDSLEAIRNRGDAAWVTGGTGSGAKSFPYTVTVGGVALGDAFVWVTSDLAGTTTIASGLTNSMGIVTFNLDLGATNYFWTVKDGYNFDNPDTEVID